MPDESSVAVPFERVAAACRAHLMREKILVVPSLAIGHQIGDRIAREGTPWINLRPETIRTLADAVTAGALAAEGITLLSRAQALALVEAACARVPGGLGYFGALADRPGLHRAIQRSIDDLRLAGATAASLQPEAFEDPRKAADLQCILDSYEHALEAGRFIDRAGVILRAVRELAAGAKGPWAGDALWIVVEDEQRSEVESRLVALAAGDAIVEASPMGSGARDVRFLRAAGEENEIRAAMRWVVGSSGSGPEAGRAAGANALRDFAAPPSRSFGGLWPPQDDIPQSMAVPASFDQAEIAYATRDVYLPLAWELSSEYAIPTTFAEGIAAHYTRPGKAAIELLRWIETWEDRHLRSAAQAGTLETKTSVELSSSAFARTLREAAIGWGRTRHVERLQALEAERAAELDDPELDDDDRVRAEARLERATATREVVEALIAAVPADDDDATIATIASALATLIESRAAVRSEIDGMAKSAIIRMLRELAAVPGDTLPKAEVCARIEGAILDLHVAASNPRPGHLHIAPIRSAGWSGRPLVFIAGLEESRYPGGGLQDPILLDAERTRLNETIDPHQLPLLADRPGRVAGEFHHLLGRLPREARLTLSWPSLDLRERRESFPSQLLLEVFRTARHLPDAGYDDLAKEVASEAFVPGSRPLSMSEWWLEARFGANGRPLGDAPRDAHPWLADGDHAMQMRALPEITPWDGKITASAEELDPRLNGKVYSASRLERMARCPYGYFLQSILGIEPLETIDRGEVWLSPMEYGSLFHEVLETFMREICARGEKPAAALHAKRLEEIARAAVQELAKKVPPPSESALIAREEDLLESCRLFLRVEEKHCGEIDAKFFEVGFGFGIPDSGRAAGSEVNTVSSHSHPGPSLAARAQDDNMPAPSDERPMYLADPLTIPLGHGKEIKLRGRIDRVDHHPASDSWHVWDYKSGSSWSYSKPGSLAAGTIIQHAIYARALNAMLAERGEKGRVSESGYYFPTVKGRGERIRRKASPGALEESLRLLSAVVGSGWFPQGDDCRFCDFATICLPTKDHAEMNQAKIAANAEERAVAAWRRLQEVE